MQMDILMLAAIGHGCPWQVNIFLMDPLAVFPRERPSCASAPRVNDAMCEFRVILCLNLCMVMD